MKTPPVTSIERRFTTGKVELRAGSDGKPPTIRGYAAIFNANSENLGGFIEVIAPGAFDGVLKDDVRALFNHDANLILGRTKSGTCTIGVDATGLWYEITPADTQTARDLMVSLKRGDVDQSSFAFTVTREGQDWTDHPDNPAMMIRTIKKVARLYDVSPVTYPAYPDTEASTRSTALAEYRAWKQKRGDAPSFNEADEEFACDMLDDLQDVIDDSTVLATAGADEALKKIAETLLAAATSAREEILAWTAANGIECDDDEEENSHKTAAEARTRQLALADTED